MSVGDICNRNPAIIGTSDSIYRAAELMRDKGVSYLVVVESRQGKSIPVGTISDRDIVIMVANRLDLEDIAIGSVMPQHQLLAHEDDRIVQTVKRMRHNGVTCLPVTSSDGALIGIVSTDDILDKQAELLNDLGYIITRQKALPNNQWSAK